MRGGGPTLGIDRYMDARMHSILTFRLDPDPCIPSKTSPGSWILTLSLGAHSSAHTNSDCGK